MHLKQMKRLARLLLAILLVGCLTDTLAADEPDDSVRTWRDQTGKFEVLAELLEVKGDRVKLRKLDGRVIEPPLRLLSREDQAFVSRWEKAQQAGNIFAGGVMEEASPEKADARASAMAKSDGVLPPWRPGSDALTFPPGDKLIFQPMERPTLKETSEPPVAESRSDEQIVVVPTMKGYVDGCPPLLVDARRKRSLIRLQSGTWDKQDFTQAVLVDPGTRRALPTTRWDEILVFVNSDPQSGRLIARAKTGSFGRTGELAVFSMTSSGQLRELVRWKPAEDGTPKVSRIHFVNDHLVTARVGDVVHAWDLAQRRGVWQLAISGWSRAARTRDNRYLAAQRKYEIGIFEMASGRQIGTLSLPEVEGASPPDEAVDLAFSPSGLKLAAVGGRTIRVFDLRDPSKDSATELTEKIDTFYSDPVWVDEDHLLVANTKLVDPKLGHLIWQYDMGSRPTMDSTFRTGLMRGTLGGRGGIAVVALAVPDDAALKAKATADFSDAVRIDHGAAVRLEVEVAEPTDRNKVQELLTKAIDKAGWTISESAPIVVRFENYRIEEIKRKYGSGRFKGQELPFRPYAAVVEVLANGEPVYRVVDPGRAPDNLEIELDETLADAIERQTVPSYRMLERLDLPPRVIAPELQQGLGKSKLTADGFVPDESFSVSLPPLPPRGNG